MANEVSITVRADDQASGPIGKAQRSALDLRDEFSRGTGVLEKWGGAWVGVAAGAAAGVTAIVGVGAAIKSFAADAIEAEQASVKLDAVLRASGGAAGITRGEIESLSNELAMLTGIADEELTNVQTLFLTFRNISGSTFREATELAADMSAVFGGDLSSSALQLAKALNDPIAGVGALRRVGVQLTEQQSESITKFVELGDVASAQRVILDELQTEVGGVSRALGETAGGTLARFNLAVGELKETIGAAILEGTTPLLEDLLELAQSEGAAETARDIAAGIDSIGNVASGAAGAVGRLNDALGVFGGLKGVGEGLIKGITGIGALEALDDLEGQLQETVWDAIATDAQRAQRAKFNAIPRITGLVDEEMGIGPAQTDPRRAVADENRRLLEWAASTQKEREDEQFLAQARLAAAANNAASALAGGGGGSSGGGGGGRSLTSAVDEMSLALEEAARITDERNLQLASKAMREAEEAARALAEQHDRLAEAERKREQELLANAQGAAGFAQRIGATSLGSQAAIAQMFGFAPPELNVSIP